MERKFNLHVTEVKMKMILETESKNQGFNLDKDLKYCKGMSSLVCRTFMAVHY